MRIITEKSLFDFKFYLQEEEKVRQPLKNICVI